MHVISESVFTILMGSPGAGKSCYTGTIVQQCIKRKIDVYSNYPVRGAYKLYTDDILKQDTHNSVVIIDEAGGEYNSRNYQKFTQDLFRFYATARHRKTQIFFVVQNWQRLDIALRELATTVIFLSKSVLPHCSWRRVFSSSVELVQDEEGNATEFKPLFKAQGFGWFYFRFLAYNMIDTYYDDHKFEFEKRELWDEVIPRVPIGERIKQYLKI